MNKQKAHSQSIAMLNEFVSDIFGTGKEEMGD